MILSCFKFLSGKFSLLVIIITEHKSVFPTNEMSWREISIEGLLLTVKMVGLLSSLLISTLKKIFCLKVLIPFIGVNHYQGCSPGSRQAAKIHRGLNDV